MELVFATNNRNKAKELSAIIPSSIKLMTLADIGCFEILQETSDTIEGNAIQKALYVFEKYKISCFADDTGLEVDALNGAPGVYSARYAGSKASSDDNINKLLSELQANENRKAQFKTVICLSTSKGDHLFEGIIKGSITHERMGANGFGYDSVFTPDGYNQTFAQMNPAEKNQISHRSLAVKKLVDFLAITPVF